MLSSAKKFSDLIGNTPLVDLSSIVNHPINLYGKCEFLNPGLSMKDRIVDYILQKAEQEKKLCLGDTIICASSGNTGLSVAMLGKIKGYKVIIVTSEKCSVEKQNHIRAFNAKLVVVDESQYMICAKEMALQHGYFDINQYENPDNPEAYYKSLAPEIWQQTEQKITHFVMTGSTFGCITGVARYLKQQNPKIKIILADPLYSNISDYYRMYQQHQEWEIKPKTKYLIEGAGKSKPTPCTDFSLIDDVINISDSEAIGCCHQLAVEEGLFVGGSSGLNICACQKLASHIDKGVIVTILCDHGIKYLSKIYNPNFLKQQSINIL